VEVEYGESRLLYHPNTYGFLVLESGGQDSFIKSENLREAIHGEGVAVRPEDLATTLT
jgi:hypothetical protein